MHCPVLCPYLFLHSFPYPGYPYFSLFISLVISLFISNAFLYFPMCFPSFPIVSPFISLFVSLLFSNYFPIYFPINYCPYLFPHLFPYLIMSLFISLYNPLLLSYLLPYYFPIYVHIVVISLISFRWICLILGHAENLKSHSLSISQSKLSFWSKPRFLTKRDVNKNQGFFFGSGLWFGNLNAGCHWILGRSPNES